MSEQLTELSYSKFAGYYSKRYWFSSEPLWTQLSDEDKKFWTEFVTGIRTAFKGNIEAKLTEAK